jgi:glycosyltransferase involved in cell wall biosynthesis
VNSDKNTQSNISCIIPAYNEGRRVLSVINAVLGHENVDEVIVVNDGSSDDTEFVLKEVKGIELISYSQNRGKSHAVMMGFKKAKNNLVIMLDADLVGLDGDSITALIKPVLENKADISISLRKNSLPLYKLLGLDFVSGERVFDKNIIENLDMLDKLRGFELESFLNKIIIHKKMRIKVVKWDKVGITRKSGKVGFLRGAIRDFKMTMEIIYFLGVTGLIRQIVSMISLKV